MIVQKVHPVEMEYPSSAEYVIVHSVCEWSKGTTFIVCRMKVCLEEGEKECVKNKNNNNKKRQNTHTQCCYSRNVTAFRSTLVMRQSL